MKVILSKLFSRKCIGKGLTRVLLAGSGLLLVLFLVIHLAGLALAVIAPNTFESYATALHSIFWLHWLELSLLAITLIHISLTFIKTIKNFQTGNTSILVSRRKDFLASLAARSQPFGGTLLFSFLLIHLGQLRFPRPTNGAELSTLQLLLGSPMTFIIYILGALALFLHLYHGIESSQRSLGLLTPENESLIRGVGRGLSVIICAGFVWATVLLGGIFVIN